MADSIHNPSAACGNTSAKLFRQRHTDKISEVFSFKIIKLLFIKTLKFIFLLSVLVFSVKLLESLLNKEAKAEYTCTHTECQNQKVWIQHNVAQRNTTP